MIDKSQLRVSLVIPVYNEESHLAFCLDAIAKMTVTPFEVIVVDNNSTDESAAVASQYSFVRVITEARQGVVFARDTGFNAVRGDIIGRIDADTQLPADWVAVVRKIFTDPAVAATSGKIHYYDQAFARVGDRVDNFCRRHLSRVQEHSSSVFLQGANLALRKDAWLATRNNMCHLDGIHEDFDLAIHLQEVGFKVTFDERLVAGISSRRIDSNIASFVRYLLVCPRTYAFHGLRSRFYMYIVGFIWMCMYVPGYLGYKSYDPSTGKYSLARILRPRTWVTRVDPSTIFFDV